MQTHWFQAGIKLVNWSELKSHQTSMNTKSNWSSLSFKNSKSLMNSRLKYPMTKLSQIQRKKKIKQTSITFFVQINLINLKGNFLDFKQWCLNYSFWMPMKHIYEFSDLVKKNLKSSIIHGKEKRFDFGKFSVCWKVCH